MKFLLSWLFIKVLIGAAIVVLVSGTVLTGNNNGDVSCATIEHYPGRSAVYECAKGMSTVYLRNNSGGLGSATVTTNVPTQGWLTKAGDSENLKTIYKRLGKPVGMQPGSYMYVANAKGLVYIYSTTTVLVSIAWHTYNVQNN